MALQKHFNDPRKQFVDPYWTIISGVLSHGRGRSDLTLDRRVHVELGVPYHLVSCAQHFSIRHRQLSAGIAVLAPHICFEVPWLGPVYSLALYLREIRPTPS
jgi:hypothetical protein